MKITIEAEVAAPIGDVWAAWTTPKDIEAWNAASDDWHCPHAEIDLRPDGPFAYRMEARDGSVGFDFTGTIAQIVPRESITYSLGDGRIVAVEFASERDRVVVRETFEAESGVPAELQRQGWQAILDNFARHVESKSR